MHTTIQLRRNTVPTQIAQVRGGPAGPTGPPGGSPFREQQYVAILGQTAFVLTVAPTQVDSVLFMVNGVVYHEVLDWVIAVATITWTNPIVLAAGDDVVVKYV